MLTAIEAALTWEDELLAFLPQPAHGGVRRRLDVAERGESFGLLEPDAHGWTLCIPAGAEADLRVGGAAIDLDALSLDASGERRVRVCAGLTAEVRMGEFRFEVRAAA